MIEAFLCLQINSWTILLALCEFLNSDATPSVSRSSSRIFREHSWGSSGPVAATLDDRVQALQAELLRVERERDILKKALVIFGRNE